MARTSKHGADQRSALVALRCTPTDKARIEAAANVDGRTVSDWLLRLAHAALAPAAPRPGRKIEVDPTDALRWRKMALSRTERAAMREFKQVVAKGHSMGRRRIVSMQGLQEAGLVKPVLVDGTIADWTLTPAGVLWDG